VPVAVAGADAVAVGDRPLVGVGVRADAGCDTASATMASAGQLNMGARRTVVSHRSGGRIPNAAFIAISLASARLRSLSD